MMSSKRFAINDVFVAMVIPLLCLALTACKADSPLRGSSAGSVSSNDVQESAIRPNDAYLTYDIPSNVDVSSKTPFASLDASEVISARATHPRVSFQDLTDQEIETLISALSSVVARTADEGMTNEWGNPSFPSGWYDGNLWFELEFATGEHWLLEVHSTWMGGDHDGVIIIGEYEIGITEDVYEALSEIYARFEEAEHEKNPDSVQPFAGITFEDVAKAECFSLLRWEELDEETEQELVDLLIQVSVDSSTGTNEIPVLYGDGEFFRQFRLTFKDGTVNVVGHGGAFYLDGITYTVTTSKDRPIDYLYNRVAVGGY